MPGFLMATAIHNHNGFSMNCKIGIMLFIASLYILTQQGASIKCNLDRSALSRALDPILR